MSLFSPFRSVKKIALAASLLLGSVSLLAASAAAAPAKFVTNLRAGQPQHVVIFGTSLSKGGAWVSQLQTELDRQFPGQVTLTNSARGGQSSQWGRANVQKGVIELKPDVVFIEFAINDSVARFKLTPKQVAANVDYMIKQIKKRAPKCEIILQIMNPSVGLPETDRSYRVNQEAYADIYRAAAKKHRVTLIDHTPTWQKILDESGEAGFRVEVPDGVHPKALAYKKHVTPTIFKAIGLE